MHPYYPSKPYMSDASVCSSKINDTVLTLFFFVQNCFNSNNNLFFFLSDLQTGPPNHKGITENTAIIAGVVAALVLLVALTLLAVYYINTHPTVAPPFYLMQVRKTTSGSTTTQHNTTAACILQSKHFILLFKDIPHAHLCLSAAWPLATTVCCS